MADHEKLRIRGFRVHRLSVPLPRSYASGMHDTCAATENILLELDVGPFMGHGRAFTFVPAHADAIRTVLIDLIDELPGHEVDDVRAISERHLRRTNFVGAGIARMAMGVLDGALWDVLAQRAELPLFRLLGGASAHLRVYASGGWLTYSDGELAEEAAALADLGYAGYKMKVGHPDWRVDVGRAVRVLEAVSGRMPVMVDANQSWTTKQALSAGLAFAELGVDWFEEPVPAEQLENQAQLAAALPLRVASGESVFTIEGFSSLIERRAADVVMPNVVRIGGPSRMIDVVSLARSAGVLVSPHLLAEVSGHVLAGLGGGDLLEHIPGWWDGLFEEAPRIEHGILQLPETSGLGIRFSARAIAEWSCDEAHVASVGGTQID